MTSARPSLPNPFKLLVNSVGFAAADAAGLAPGKAAQWNATLEAYVALTGKLTKLQVLYTPFQPPPFFWDYNCARCRFWTEPNGCTLVDGWIARGGWCAIYMPPDGVKPFTWPTRVLQDVPTWLGEAPAAFKNWFKPAQTPKELPAPKDGGTP